MDFRRIPLGALEDGATEAHLKCSWRIGEHLYPGTYHLALSVPSIRDAVKRLNEAGFPVPESGIKPMGKQAQNCFLCGPDGEIVELCEGSLN